MHIKNRNFVLLFKIKYVENQKKKSYDTMMMYEIAETIKDAPTIYYLDNIIEQLKELKTYKLDLADAISKIMCMVNLKLMYVWKMYLKSSSLVVLQMNRLEVEE